MTMSHAAYDLVSVRPLEEYRCTGRLFRHRKTGCEVYHLESEDEENVFAFAFRTSPRDGTGVAHIVEHSVLCGSERFPVKDSFLVMARRSMATFMNAFTYPDKTVYPAASVVEADYFNLMDVYGDAVFFPRLDEGTFLQEAHRLAVDEGGKLDLKGVVYNEMRGDYSSSESLSSTASYTSLFSPGHPYSFDSGGDPAVIPTLDYKGFKDFWSRHYHPSNCRIYLYGNIDTQRQLDFLDERFLSRFEAIEVDSEIPLQAPMAEPRRLELPYPLAEGSDSATSIVVNWLTAPITDSVQALAMELLSEILVGHDGAILSKTLRESGLGEDLSPQCGLDTSFRQLIFSAGLRGTQAGREEAIEKLIVDTIEAAAASGFTPEALDAAIHTVSFSNKEIRRGAGAYGLRLFNKAIRGWLHGAAPEATLSFELPMAELRSRMEGQPRYLESLALSMISRNAHRSTVTVYPEAGLLERRNAEREAELARVAASLSKEELKALKLRGERLDEAQRRADPPEAVAKLPRLTRGDLPREVETVVRREARIGEVPTILHPIFTNGIVYLDMAFPLDCLNRDSLAWLPLVTRFVTSAGLPGQGYDRVAEQLARASGGFGAYLDSSTRIGGGEASSFAFIRLKALKERFPRALDLALELLASADWKDEKRVEDIFAELRNDIASAIVPAGNSFAQTRAASALSEASAIEDIWRGTSQVEFVLAPSRPRSELAQAVGAASSSIFCRKGLRLSITAEDGDLPGAMAAIEKSLSMLPAEGSGLQPPAAPFPPASGPEAYSISAQVGFAAAAFPASRIGTKACGNESLLAHWLNTGPLWEELRVRRGAYGASAWTDGVEGMACLSTYRDPSPAESLPYFAQALEEAARSFGLSGDCGEAELEEALVGAIGRDQRPMLPEEKGFIDFKRSLVGITDELRQVKRDAMLSATCGDLSDAAARLAAACRSPSAVLISRAEDAYAMVRWMPATKLRELPL